MNEDRIITKGDTAKYQIEIEHADFDMVSCNFYVKLLGNMFLREVTVTKEEMPMDEDGNWFLIFSSSDMAGWLQAECHYFVPDSDSESGVREEVDLQWLGFVTAVPAPRFACDGKRWGNYEENPHVKYTRVWRGDVNTLYLNLRTSEQQPIVDCDGKQLRVRKEEKDIY